MTILHIYRGDNTKMNSWVILVASGFVLIGISIYISSIYNGLVNLRKNIQRAWSNVDVLLKQRYDELPRLVATVKGYAKHEKEVFEQVTKARSAFDKCNSVTDFAKADRVMHDTVTKIFVLAEDYPELKADGAFIKLQGRISEIEDHIADRRELYNDWVTQYNTRIEQVPDVMVASLFKYSQAEWFKAKSKERKVVKVKM